MAGAGYKLFNTGDVLTAAQVNTYLQEQAVMRFANATARTTALSGVLAEGMMSYLDDTNSVEVYNGSAWVSVGSTGDITGVTAGTGISGGGTSGDVTITNSMATAIDAKGDLISATAADTPARLASSGNNGDVLTVDTSTSTGLKWAAPAASGDTFAAGKNKVLNGDFNIWQRGTSFTGTSPYYTADRFIGIRVFGSSGATFSRQTSGLTNFQYSIRAQRNSGNTSTDGLIISQCLESATSYPLAGKSVTLSFYAKCGANYSSASSALSSQIRYGTGTDQNYITGSYTGDTQVVAGTHTLTTSWQRFYITGTVNSAATEVGFDLRYTPVGTASTNDWFEITGVQLELGSVPTTFKRAGGTLAGELAACQRYYWRWSASNGAVYSFMGTGWVYSGTIFALPVVHPVQMRVAPTSIDTSGTASHYRVLVGATQYNNTSVPSLDQANAQTSSILFTNAGTMTAGQAGGAGANNTTSAYIGFNAEL